MIMLDPKKTIIESFDAAKVWSIERTHGSQVLMRMGTPSVNFVEPQALAETLEQYKSRGTFRRRSYLLGTLEIIIASADWNLLMMDTIICDCNDSHKSIDDGLWYIKGQAISEISFGDLGVDSIYFDLGAIIRFNAASNLNTQCVFRMLERKLAYSFDSNGGFSQNSIGIDF